MKVRNTTQQVLSIGNPSLSIGPGEFATVNTFQAMISTEIQSLISSGQLALTTLATAGQSQFDQFVGTQASQGTISSTDATALTSGSNTALHFHATDRARAGHTGTQLLATIGDVTATAAQVNKLTNNLHPGVGATGARPVAPATGFMHFDTTAGIPIWFNGTIYVKSDGTAA